MRVQTHEHWMQQALHLAENGRCTVSPNPMVGCVIVKDQQCLAKAWHQQAGSDHAEIIALQQAGAEAADATLYITLEPCCHHGKTPPCVDAIVQAKISTVVIAIMDPNPQVAGKGILVLQNAGINVVVDICEQQAHALNKFFFHAMQYNRPYVIAKWAMSLDGLTKTVDGDNKKITSEQSQQHVHQQRATIDAILIGAKTLINDDPQLTVRLQDKQITSAIRIVLTANNALPLASKIFNDQFRENTWVVTADNNENLQHKELIELGVKVFRLPQLSSGQLDLNALMNLLHQHTIRSLYIEGGQQTHAHFFQQQLVDEIHTYIAPCVITDSPTKKYLNNLMSTRLGNDLFCTATMQQQEK